MRTNSEPVFVVGIWRSGTSLLYALLNQHPDISLMYESDLLLLWPLFSAGRSQADWKQRWDFWNSGLSRHHLDPGHLPDNIPSLAAAIETVGREYADGAIWGCKSPSYYDRLGLLSRIFPRARFIIIWRDPADTCRSIVRASQKTPWFGKTGMATRALLGNVEMKKGRDLLHARGCQVHELQYEDMVADPASSMQGICQFLQIPYDPRMASLEGADRSAIFSHDHHALVKGKQIVARSSNVEVLPPQLKQKIDRYIAYWRQQSGGLWPAYPLALENSAPASLFERASDRIGFSLLRAWDRITAVIYCFAPLPLLRGYRGRKRPYEPLPQEGALQSAKADVRQETLI